MKSRGARVALVIAIAASFGLTGCMEVEQNAAGSKQGRYQGKLDGKPWDNDPLAAGAGNGKWSKGDKVSWETQIKARNNGQNEYKRIGQ
jgi:hypothetical protein